MTSRSTELRQQETALRQRARERARLRLLPDTADLRPQARRILEALRRGDPQPITAPVNPAGFSGPPATIRVWRRSLGGNDSCAGQVDTMSLEDYVKGVVPHEWIPSWELESLKAGAIAARSYGASWVEQGGKYQCADVCDTTSTQVYKDSTDPSTDQAVDETKSQVMVSGSAILFAEYSAENGDPTADGVSDPVCAGKAVNGHGRGMCQWGTQRWALQGKDYQWISLHYYPGSSLWTPETVPPPPPPLAQDGGTTPPPPPPPGQHDTGAPPPPPTTDAAVAPPAPAASEAGEPVAPGTPPSSHSPAEAGGLLDGGCAVSPGGGMPLGTPMLVLAAFALLSLIRPREP